MALGGSGPLGSHIHKSFVFFLGVGDTRVSMEVIVTS